MGEGDKFTRQELINGIYCATSVSRQDVVSMVSQFVEQICLALEKGKQVEIRGFGTFSLKRRKSRHNARNPRRPQESIRVEEHNVVVFRPGRRLREQFWKIK